MFARLAWCLLFLLGVATSARADAVLLVGETYGTFGRFSPTGHAAVYLTHVCAETPVTLRRCEPGELGTVISRYHSVAGRDWMAMPLMPYFYGVERADAVPPSATRADVLSIRDRYRRAHLREYVPDGPEGATPKGNWIQLVGAAYDRRFQAFAVSTTEQQDDDLIARLNGHDNRERFNLLSRNCADFSRDIINSFYPGSIRNSVVADLGITTPKQLGHSLTKYAASHADIGLTGFLIEQVPGSRPASGHPRGVLESLVKTKKYMIPLVVVQPIIPTTIAAGYLVTGRFNPAPVMRTVALPDTLEKRVLKARGARVSRD